MKISFQFFISFILILAFLTSVRPCGPSYITPIFVYERAPENPFENFAAGKLGILIPTQRRIVLLAAFRYLSGGGFSQNEQQALVDVWNAEFNNRGFDEENIAETVKKWVEKRKEVVGKEEKPPDIYVEREYGSYDFFPNCTKNAFETAIETLSDRSATHGSDDRHVLDWVQAQDKVFANCASGISIPDPPDPSTPEWLQKDRSYQLAAARFYALDYEAAKRGFAEIALDAASPWQETAEYLVGRTLIRQASLTKDGARINLLYTEAEQVLAQAAQRGGKFSRAAEKLLGLVSYRLHPEKRVRELAQKLGGQGSDNFRQDLIDYNWLLDKFEKQTLEREEERKAAEMLKKAAEKYGNAANAPLGAVPTKGSSVNSNASTEPESREGEIKIHLYNDDYSQNWTFFIKVEATDDEALAEAEKAIGRPLSDKMKEQVRNARKSGYAGRFSEGRQNEYEGGYYGSEEISLSVLPDFLRGDELTEWLFTFQINTAEAYLYSLNRYRQTNSELWLLTALAKADASSTELNRLLEAGDRVGASSPAFATVTFHRARILTALGKTTEARKLLDELLEAADELPISTKNRLMEQRMKLSDKLDDFIKYSMRRSFAFDYDGLTGTIDQIIAEQKTWYDPKNEKRSREDYEREVEEIFSSEKLWQKREMFDSQTIETINRHFPLSLLSAIEKSPALPEYMRERFIRAIWTRAVLVEDFAAARKAGPELVSYHPELQALMEKFLLANTPVAQKRAVMFLILKNPMLSPYVADGMDQVDNEFNSFDSNNWWCALYEPGEDGPAAANQNAAASGSPSFITAAETQAVERERKILKQIGDAPKFYGGRVLEWARLAPADKRLPESLYIVWAANGWSKYGCGNNIELRQKIAEVLMKRYPDSEWTKRMAEEAEPY